MSSILDTVGNVLQTAFGIGGLIFVHELGHFLVGRWCGVHAEAFSIGFGKPLLRWKPGDTEYRLSPIPLGGYVKFLQESSDEQGEPLPDSFMAATYPRKVAILSAGVVMNVIAAFFLFAGAYSVGVEAEAPVLGSVLDGSPAWEAGLREGDEVVAIDGGRVLDFHDIMQASMLHDELRLTVRRNGEELPPITAYPRPGASGRKQLGVQLPSDAQLVVVEESLAATAGFRTGDRPLSVDGVAVTNVGAALEAYQATKAATVSSWVVERDGAEVALELPIRRSRMLGAHPDGDTVGAVLRDGAAARAGVRSDDVVVSVGGASAPSVLAAAARIADPAQPGPLVVRRDDVLVTIELPDGETARAEFLDGLRVRHDWTGPAYVGPMPGKPSALRAAGIPAGSTVVALDGSPTETFADVQKAVSAAVEDNRTALDVTWRAPGGEESRQKVELIDGMARVDAELGLDGRILRTTVQESNVIAAAGLGVERTQRWVGRIFRTLGSIFSGGISARELSGPIQIARVSYDKASDGLGQFLLFLGMISVNLAVLNILPVPVLDGGQIVVHTAERVYGKRLPVVLVDRIQLVGLVLLLGLMVFVIGNDIVRLVT